MSHKPRRKRLFPGQLGTSVFVGVLIGFVGIVGWIIGYNLPKESSSLVTLISTVSSSLLTIGVASVIYEAFQRDKFLAEVASTVGIAESISLSGFKFLAEPSSELFSDCFKNSTTFRLAPIDPQNWTRQYMPKIFQAANERDLEIHLYLPSHESNECVALIANMHSLEIDSVKKSLESLPLQVSAAWKKSINRRASKLKISTYSNPISNGYISSNDNSIIEISGLTANDMAIRPHLWSCVALKSTTGDWITAQLNSIEEDSGIVDMPTSDNLIPDKASGHGGSA